MTTLKPAIYTPTSAKGVYTPSSSDHQKSADQRPNFVAAASNMALQLAVVFLVPVVIGHELDNHFHTQPLWTGVGFVLALAGMTAVVWRQVRLAAPKITQADIDHAKRLRDEEDEEE